MCPTTSTQKSTRSVRERDAHIGGEGEYTGIDVTCGGRPSTLCSDRAPQWIADRNPDIEKDIEPNGVIEFCIGGDRAHIVGGLYTALSL